MIKSKKILVTGATGFIGSALVERLITTGAEVRTVGRHSVSKARWFDHVVVPDISGVTEWCTVLESVDCIVHLAARAHIAKELSTNNPLNAFRQTNVEGTLHLARQAVNAGVRRFIFMSSIGVNGSTTSHAPFSVDSAPAPHSPYAQSKYEAEQGLRFLAEKTGLELVILRPPLVYGADAPGSFGILMRLLSQGWPLPLGLVTNNSRSLVALDNLIDLIVICLNNPAAANQIFLVSDGEDISTTDLLNRLGNAMKKPPRLLPVPVSLLAVAAKLLGKPEMFQSLCGSLQVDIDKTRQLLDWSPLVSVNEGLKRAVGGFRC